MVHSCPVKGSYTAPSLQPRPPLRETLKIAALEQEVTELNAIIVDLQKTVLDLMQELAEIRAVRS